MLIKSIDNSPDQCKLLFLPVYQPKSCQIFCKTQLSGVWHVICLITEMVKYLYKSPSKRNGLLLFFTFSGIGAQKIRFYVGTCNSKPQVPVFFQQRSKYLCISYAGLIFLVNLPTCNIAMYYVLNYYIMTSYDTMV